MIPDDAITALIYKSFLKVAKPSVIKNYLANNGGTPINGTWETVLSKEHSYRIHRMVGTIR